MTPARALVPALAPALSPLRLPGLRRLARESDHGAPLGRCPWHRPRGGARRPVWRALAQLSREALRLRPGGSVLA